MGQRGGARDGAGHPRKTGPRSSRKPEGVVRTLKAIGVDVPPRATKAEVWAAIEDARESDRIDPAGHEAFGVVLRVMRGEIRRGATAILGAARDVLDRRRGMATRHVEVSGSVDLAASISEGRKRAAEIRAARQAAALAQSVGDDAS